MQLAEPTIAAPFRRFLQALANEHPVYIVGGWLRDALQGKKASDADFATAAPPDAIARLAAEHRLKIFADQVAAVHGTWRMTTGRPFEVLDLARLREDVVRVGARHAQVRFTHDILLDLARRDLTINGMAMRYPFAMAHVDPSGALAHGAGASSEQQRGAKRRARSGGARRGVAGLIDCFGGQRDLRGRRLALIGSPPRRLQEDPLRLLRVLRFAAAGPSWTVAPTTWLAVRQAAPLLAGVSCERLRSEWQKSLGMPAPSRFWQLAQRSGVLPQLWPTGGYGAAGRRACRTLLAAASRGAAAELRLFALLLATTQPRGKQRRLGPRAAQWAQQQKASTVAQQLRRLRFANAEVRRAEQLCLHFPWRPATLVGERLARWLIAVGEPGRQQAMVMARYLCAGRVVARAPYAALWRRVARLLGGRAVPTLQELAIDARDLMGGGLALPGPALGLMLQRLHIWAVARGAWQDGHKLLSAARDMVQAAQTQQAAESRP